VFRVRVSRRWGLGIKGEIVNDEIEYKAD
jgi:hypothetical protein